MTTVLMNAKTGEKMKQWEVPPNHVYSVISTEAGMTYGPTGPEPILIITIDPTTTSRPLYEELRP